MSSRIHIASARAIGYCRVSQPGQSSIPEQRAWVEGEAKERGWPLVEVVADEGRSGDDAKRPGLARLERLLAEQNKAGYPVNVLLVWHTDRLSRADAIDAFALVARLRAGGLRWIVTHDQCIDLHDATHASMLAMVQNHSSNPFLVSNAERALGGMLSSAMSGHWVGRIPTGYRKVAGSHPAGSRRRACRLEVDPDKAPIVKELFKRYLDGQSTTSLARWLDGQLPARRRHWTCMGCGRSSRTRSTPG